MYTIYIMYFNNWDCTLFSDAVSSQEEQIDVAEVSLIVFGFSTIENWNFAILPRISLTRTQFWFHFVPDTIQHELSLLVPPLAGDTYTYRVPSIQGAPMYFHEYWI